MKWIGIHATTTVEAEEAVANIMYEMGANGVVIKDPNDIRFVAEKNTWDYVDPDMIVDDNHVEISSYFLDKPGIEDKIVYIKERIIGLKDFDLDIGDFKLTTSEIDDVDWQNNWKKYYKPLKIGKNIVIKPSWETYVGNKDDIIIELNPGMAFGTGLHETTKMCIEYLEDHIKSGVTVFDIGCGSGILSIVSSKLGAKKVYAVDTDDLAVSIARDNAKMNHIRNLEIFKSNLFDTLNVKADIIVANIIADIIKKSSEGVSYHLNNNGLFISSGIIKDRKDDVMLTINKYFDILDIKEDGEWVAILSKKK